MSTYTIFDGEVEITSGIWVPSGNIVDITDRIYNSGGTLYFNGGPFVVNLYTSQTGSYTFQNDEYGIFMSASGNSVITLSSSSTNKQHNIKRVDTGVYTVTVTGEPGVLIDNQESVSIESMESLHFLSDGTNWYII